jgi:hypothetical protein
VHLVLFVLKQQTSMQLQYAIYESLYGKANPFQVRLSLEG